MGQSIKVLIVEDSKYDAALLIRTLQRCGYEPTYIVVDTPEAMADALCRQEWELVISDYSMPRFSGPDALKLLKEKDPDLSFILMTGEVGEEVAVEVMRAGAQDYILKGNPTRLIPAVERELLETRARRDNRKNEKALLESRERYRLIVETSTDGIWQVDETDRTVFINQKMSEMLGYAVDELMELTPYGLMDEEWGMFAKANMQHQHQGNQEQHEYKYQRKDGTDLWVIVSAFPMFYSDGKSAGLTGIHTNITDRKRAEKALRVSEEKFSKAFNVCPSPMAISTFPEQRYVDVNEAWIRERKFHREEVIGVKGSELNLWTKPDDLTKAIQMLNENKSLRNLETSVRTKSGELKRVLMSADILETDGANYMLAFTEDITERKTAQELMDKYMWLSTASQDIILYIRCSDGRIIEASENALREYNYSRSELLEMTVYDLCAKNENEHQLAIKQMKQACEKGIRFETCHFKKDGNAFPVEVNSLCATINGEQIILSIIRNITDRKMAEEELLSVH